jgi:glucose/arabinose dehydrogenase
MRRQRTSVLWACAVIVPATLMAQPPGRAAGPRVAGPPSFTSPPPVTTEGQPIESRPPEKQDDKPSFSGQTRAPYHATAAPVVTTLTDQLRLPWSLAFLPSGKILITEKLGTMRVLDKSGALSEPVKNVPAVEAIGQVGLLDVALDPGFAANHRMFFTYSEAVGQNDSQMVVARATFDEGANALSDVSVIFRANPPLPKRQSSNAGGRIVIARDGNLFVTIGDRSQSPPWDRAQKLDNHLGKMIRITPDGKPAPGNPFIGKEGALPEIWSYGHRSEEGLTINPTTGELWETEHGPRGGDEINTPEAGKNYGWPVIVHGIDYPGTMIGQGITEQAGMEQPHYYWDPVIAPSGLAFYNGNLFPQWKDSLFVGALRGQFLDRLTMNGKRVVAEEPLLVSENARIRDVRMGLDGAVYVLSDNGKLFKLTSK